MALVVRRGEAADDIGLTLAAGKAVEQVGGIVEVIDQGEDAAAIAAGIEPDRRPGPIDR